MAYRNFHWKTPARVVEGNVIYLRPKSENVTITKTEPVTPPMFQMVFGIVIVMFFVLLFGPGYRFNKK